MLLTLSLSLAAYEDFKKRLIPNRIVLFVGFVALLANKNILSGVISAALVGFLMLIISIFLDSFGGGDVKLITAYALSTNCLSVLIVLLVAVALCTVFGRINNINVVPFAPFLLISHILINVITTYI